jgi:hypothetical protein
LQFFLFVIQHIADGQADSTARREQTGQHGKQKYHEQPDNQPLDGEDELQWNAHLAAERFLCSGLEVGQWMPREELPGYLALARLCAAKGDMDGMGDALRRLDMRWPDIHYCTEAVRVVSALKANRMRETSTLAWAIMVLC